MEEINSKSTTVQSSKLIQTFKISRTFRWIIFTLLILILLVCNLDQGAISGSTTDVKLHFGISDTQLGTFGSIVFIGNPIGCIFSLSIINYFNRKYSLILTLSLNVVCIYGIVTLKEFYLVLLCRVISGFSVSFVGIYTPVWCDQFGIKKKRSLMIALVHIFSPIGYISGYILGSLTSWRECLIIQNILTIILIGIIAVFINKEYFSLTVMPISSNEHQVISGREINPDEISLFEDVSEIEHRDISKESFYSHIKTCLTSKVFIFTNIGLTVIYFIVSGIQFWINDYLENVLFIESKSMRLYLFGVICSTSPPLGIIIGGFITTYIGGYESKRAPLIPIIGSMIVSLFANFIIITNNIPAFSFFLWIYLFFGSLILPTLTGIILCSVPKEFAGSASALSTFIYNIFGKFPSPSVYGWIKDMKTPYPKLPMGFIANSAFLGLIAFIIAGKYHRQKFKEFEFELKEKNDIEKV